jgi:hypothetical protein
MCQAIWGLPQAGILANKGLRKKLVPFGYFECVNTPGQCYHELRSILFTLAVDNFGEKYVGGEHARHLIDSTKAAFSLTKDWTGNLYCDISLKWDYINQTVDISMPNYAKKKMQEYNHVLPNHPQYCSYLPKPKRFGSEAQAPLPPNALPPLDAKGIKRVQKIVGSIFYYAHAVDMTVLMTLSSIAVEQTTETKRTMGQCIKLLEPHNKFSCASPLPCFRYDNEYPF